MATQTKELDRPPVQTEIRKISATPEGVVYESAGVLIATEAGQMFLKTTPVTLNTGWLQLATV